MNFWGYFSIVDILISGEYNYIFSPMLGENPSKTGGIGNYTKSQITGTPWVDEWCESRGVSNGIQSKLIVGTI